jgi:hypothetical protein
MSDLIFTGNKEFFQEIEDARQEMFEMFLQEGGNNGDPVLNEDAYDFDSPEFIMWMEK